MHCDQCGKENREGSKFCRSCGAPLIETSKVKISTRKVNSKSAAIILVSLIVLGGLCFGGYKAYAYSQVQSKISSAKKMQSAGDFNGSLSALNNLGSYSLTAGQQTTTATLKANDQKFITFQTSFAAAVALENSTSTASTSISVNLQSALKDLQSIDTTYPKYSDVQVETTKVQNLLVTSLENVASSSNEAAANASLAAANAKAQASSASAAKVKAEENAQKAQSEADTAASNAAEQQTYQIELSFVNALQSAYTDFKSNAKANFNLGIQYLNSGDDSSALIYFAKCNAANTSASDAATALSNNYTNLPSAYTEAASDLQEAAYYESLAANSAISQVNNTYDTSATTNTDSSEADAYSADVASFLINP